jgi:transposase
MRRGHGPYPPELRRRLVEMVRAGRSATELSEEFEPSDQCIRNWVKQAERDEGNRPDGLTTTEKEELARLRREVERLREERAILAKATAWFARETGKIPSGSSNS